MYEKFNVNNIFNMNEKFIASENHYELKVNVTGKVNVSQCEKISFISQYVYEKVNVN